MKNNLMIASPYEERALSLKQGLNGLFNYSVITDKLRILWDEVVHDEPGMVLIDFDLLGLKNLSDVARLNSLCEKTKVVILGGEISEDMEGELLMAGVRGCCRYEISPDLLKQVVKAVQQDELWARRSITSRLLDRGNISSKHMANQASHDFSSKLTQREYEIASHVGNGEKNPKIAQMCAISERTVKAHLSATFKKLGIRDRIELAMMMSSNYSHRNDDEFENNVTEVLSRTQHILKH